MYRDYTELNALPPEAFKEPDKFDTEFDKLECNVARKQAKYEEGLAISRASKVVFIAANGTWGADGKDGSLTTSYEGIGYHTNTSELLRGFLDGPAKVVVYRHGLKEPVTIKEETPGK